MKIGMERAESSLASPVASPPIAVPRKRWLFLVEVENLTRRLWSRRLEPRVDCPCSYLNPLFFTVWGPRPSGITDCCFTCGRILKNDGESGEAKETYESFVDGKSWKE